MAVQKVNTNESGAEPRTNKRVSKGLVPNNRSSHNPPNTAKKTMSRVRHPTCAPRPTNRMSTIGVRLLRDGALFGIIACEFYHIGLKLVNNFTNEYFLSRPIGATHVPGQAKTSHRPILLTGLMRRT